MIGIYGIFRLNNLEKSYIQQYLADGWHLYNGTLGGDGGDTISKLSPEHYEEFIKNRSHKRPEHSIKMKELYASGKRKPICPKGGNIPNSQRDKIRQWALTHENPFKGHTEETKQYLREKASQRIWMHKGIKNTTVYPEMVSKFLENGYEYGVYRNRQSSETIESIK